MGRGEHEATTALIHAAYGILEAEQPTTVRRVVYALFNAKKIDGTNKAAENVVSRLLTKARKDGRIPWDWMVDEHRQPERVLTFRDPAHAMSLIKERYRKDYWPTQPINVRVWSEKSTVSGILAPVLREYEVGFLALHGNNSWTRLPEACATQRRDGRPWLVLYVGDWDPSGCRMSDDDLPKRIAEDGANITVKRIALVAADLPGLQRFSFDVDDKRKAEVAKHGAHVGKRGMDNNKGWFVERFGRVCMELDAMSSEDLRTRVAREIQRYINRDAWEKMRLCEQAELDTVDEFCGRFNRRA